MGRNHNCLANVLDKIQQFIGRTCFPAIWEIDVWQAASRIGTFLMALLGGTQSSKATNIAASNWLHIWLISIEYFCLYTSLIESFVIFENFWYIAIEVGCDSKREPTTKLSLGSSGKDLHHKSHHVQCKHEMKNLLILKSSPHSFEVLNVVFLSPTSACKPLSSCSFPAIFGTTSKVHPTGPLIHTALAQSQAHTRSQIQLSQTAQGSSHMPWDVAKNDRNDVCSSESMFNPLGVVDFRWFSCQKLGYPPSICRSYHTYPYMDLLQATTLRWWIGCEIQQKVLLELEPLSDFVALSSPCAKSCHFYRL